MLFQFYHILATSVLKTYLIPLVEDFFICFSAVLGILCSAYGEKRVRWNKYLVGWMVFRVRTNGKREGTPSKAVLLWMLTLVQCSTMNSFGTLCYWKKSSTLRKTHMSLLSQKLAVDISAHFFFFQMFFVYFFIFFFCCCCCCPPPWKYTLFKKCCQKAFQLLT